MITIFVSIEDVGPIIKNVGIQKRKTGNPGSSKKLEYLDCICAFDIETSRIKEIEQSVMYIWMFQIGTEYTIIGRHWHEFIKLCLIVKNNIPSGSKMVVYVHNLSYEFAFLKGIYNFTNDEIFAVKSRKVLKCSLFDCIEMRCSYFLSNMSLAQYTKKMGVKHQKLSGEIFDYNIERYWWTFLSDYEIEYCVNDVLGLVEAIEVEMSIEDDNLYTIPLTSTGFVRRNSKKAMRQVNPSFVKQQLPDYNLYKMLREAFRGGDTHANRYYVGRIIENVNSKDRISSYPDVLCNQKYPISKFIHKGDVSQEEIKRWIFVRHKAVVTRVAFTDIELSDIFNGFPYIPRDKCRKIRNPLIDNGRILKADYLEITVTDIDLKIILDQYSFSDAVFYDCAISRYGYLPKQLVKTIILYYQRKTDLKDIKGSEIFYTKNKNLLNSIYGMTAQDPVKQSWTYQNGVFTEDIDDPETLLFNSNKRAFLCYQWGVWTTALARYELHRGINIIGDDAIYVDTDSVKYINEHSFDNYNKEKIKLSKESGCFAIDKHGVTHYMGVYETETTYSKFITYGAKKYAYTFEDGKTHTTVAGVNKKKGGEEIDKYGGLEKFKPGFIFKEAGGTEAIYNDNPPISIYIVDGRVVNIVPNVLIKDSTYTLGISAEYNRLLNSPEILKKALQNL